MEILVSGNSVSVTIIGDGYSSYTALDFSSDYNTVNISGDVTSDDPDDCTGDITGNAARLDRFTDMGDGTVRDNRTNLLWLKDANTFPYPMDLVEATASVNGLAKWGEWIGRWLKSGRLAPANKIRMGRTF